MKTLWTVFVYLNVFIEVAISGIIGGIFKNVLTEREKLRKKEIDMMLGSDIILNDSEQQANNIIMDLKHNELAYGFKYPEAYNLSKHFFEYKDAVKKSKLFNIIREMPKGAVLHAHNTAMLGPDYVLQLTYKENLYVCFEDSNVQFLFAEHFPNKSCISEWQLMKNARYSSGNIKKFDADLRKHFTLVVDNPKEVYKDINTVWSKFQQYFITTSGLFSYKPVWEQYFYDTLKAFREDNVMYIEIRSGLSNLYCLQGNEYDSVETAKTNKKILEQFLKEYPDFFGVKLIYTRERRVENKAVKSYLDTALRLQKEVPDFIAGFDLDGQEDLGMPLLKFLDILSEAAGKFDYFFHAGETNWYGTTSDENLFDAIALGTRRIGHGFAIIKHPLLIKEVKDRDIALEVNVVSNQILKLVDDIRNHPLAVYIAQNLPLVISSDDNGVWEAEPMSHDYYVTFVGVASWYADLRLLKKLALNSIHYSTYHDKDKMFHEFEIRWMQFVNNVVISYAR